jgi:two-component system, OmpR family, sensor histidine kinase KdpD
MAASITGATIVVAILQDVGHVPFASPVYLLAVLVVGMFAGTTPAVLTGIFSFLLYDFLFTQPIYTLTVADPDEWLNLLLFLVIAVVIGRLVAAQAAGAAQVAERAREAVALFRISRSLATSDGLVEGARAVLDELAVSTSMDRVWLGLGATTVAERIVADSRADEPLPVPVWMVVLQRRPGDEPAAWARTHVPADPARRRGAASVYRVRIEVPGEVLGSLWALRTDRADVPDRAETRVVAAAADQLGQAVHKDRLTRNALDAEVARRSEALKTALLDSVSHDLRTPLAAIRAAAGSMLDPEVSWTDAERAGALRTIDAEAERMNRLVRNLLDLSRIEGGALRPELEPHDVDALVERVVERLAPGETIQLDLPDDLPPVLVDDTYADEVLTNLIENAMRYGGDLIRVAARRVPEEPFVELVVEDDGPGVADAELPHLFEKFYRVHGPRETTRHGMGIGLTVAQGLCQAMGGQMTAGRGELGGLAVRVRLPSVELPVETAMPVGSVPPAGEVA